jgi:diguanylate cyclase (GGDEF)-like protein
LRYAPTVQSTAATVIGLLYVFGGIAGVLGAQFPMSPQLAIGLSRCLGIFSFCIAAPLLALRHRLGAGPLNAALAAATIMVSALVAATGSAVGVILPGVFYICIALIAAYFFPTSQARAQAVLAAGGFSAGVVASGVHDLLVPWLVVTTAVLAASELLRHLVAQLRRQAALDPLTGLANRAYFQLAAERELALAGRGQSRFSIALLDLDGFKAVNDTYGHVAGDELLTELAGAWQGQIRRADLLSRYGGDEFALLMPDTDRDEAEQVVERLRNAHTAQWSAGVVSCGDETELNQLLHRADQDLYRAKNARTATRTRQPRRGTADNSVV